MPSGFVSLLAFSGSLINLLTKPLGALALVPRSINGCIDGFNGNNINKC